MFVNLREHNKLKHVYSLQHSQKVRIFILFTDIVFIEKIEKTMIELVILSMSKHAQI